MSRYYPCVALSLCALSAVAHASPPDPHPISIAFHASWSRSPDANALIAREPALSARAQVLKQLTPEPPSVEIRATPSFVSRVRDPRAYEVTVAAPLWRVGERSSQSQLIAAERIELDTRVQSAKLKLAGEVRAAYWTLAKFRADLESAQVRRAAAQQLADDVDRRVRAGDMAPIDLQLAMAQVAIAELAVEEAQGAIGVAELTLSGLTGLPATSSTLPTAEPASTSRIAPSTAELEAKRETIRHASALAAAQSRTPWELSATVSRERGNKLEQFSNSVVLGVRLPIGQPSQSAARLAELNAERTMLDLQVQRERQTLESSLRIARARLLTLEKMTPLLSTRLQRLATAQSMIEKNFEFGESALPDLIRARQEAHDVRRQVARHQIELAAAHSEVKQALGELPE